ncbi:hypothetical protein GCM10023176_34710 [Micromonospora coerulea]|uniref:Uncharacterized protein n=1 Tax=Micromonospora coerulea TaxID=47856 RepID=A0ABP8SQ07_9ACTN
MHALDCATMAEIVLLGEVTCPSGQLVLMDGGYLGLWSGDRAPEDVRQRGRSTGSPAARSTTSRSMASRSSTRCLTITAVSAASTRRCVPFRGRSRTATVSDARSPKATRTS